MYKITKTVGDTETVSLPFDDVIDVQKIFSDLQYDEYVRFRRLYACGIRKEIREEKVDGKIVCREYRLSVPTFSVTITLEHTED